MQVYLVKRHDSGNLLGLFWAHNLDELWDLVDEAADPVDYSYAAIAHHRGGALLNDIPGDVPPPIQDGVADPEDDDAEDPFSFGAFHASETFGEIISTLRDLRWRRFDSAFEGHGMIARIFSRTASLRAEGEIG